MSVRVGDKIMYNHEGVATAQRVHDISKTDPDVIHINHQRMTGECPDGKGGMVPQYSLTHGVTDAKLAKTEEDKKLDGYYWPL
jgi:hypothetical protein